jgi:hypothetical protein
MAESGAVEETKVRSQGGASMCRGSSLSARTNTICQSFLITGCQYYDYLLVLLMTIYV